METMTDILLDSNTKIMDFPVIDIKMGCMQLKNKLKQQYSQITDDDLICSGGKRDLMLQTLQQKLGKSAPELRDLIRKL